MAIEHEFRVGDVVRLRSGGPLMTVEKIDITADGTQSILVAWFVDKQRQSGRFHPSMLESDSGIGIA